MKCIKAPPVLEAKIYHNNAVLRIKHLAVTEPSQFLMLNKSTCLAMMVVQRPPL